MSLDYGLGTMTATTIPDLIKYYPFTLLFSYLMSGLNGTNTLSGEVTISKLFCPPLGANSYVLE